MTKAASAILRDAWIALAAAALSVPVGLLANLMRGHPLDWVYRPPDERLAEGLPGGGMRIAGEPRRLTLEEALAEFEEQSALFLDAREPAFFEFGHIPGAVNLPRSGFRERAASIEKSRRLIVYCSGEDCKDSLVVARALLRLGHGEVAIFPGGWEEWAVAGLPEERAP